MVVRPNVKPHDWIVVENVDCVVAMVRDPEFAQIFGELEVVFDPKKPTSHDVEWTVGAWTFCKRSDFGGYADRYSRLSAFVRTLRAGRYGNR